MDNAQLRAQIREFIGLQKSIPEVSYTVLEETTREGYTQYLINYPGSENDIIPAYLLVPHGEGPFPAILAHHQHNGERHLGKSEIAGLVGSPLQAFGPALAKKGFVVLAPDSICFEDRRKNTRGTAKHENDWLQHFNEMCYRIVKGGNLMKKVLDDADIGLNVLKNHPKADTKRLGVLGHSYGGNTVLYQTALNADIQFACASGAAATFERRMQDGTGIEMASVIPGFYKYYDIPDLIMCIAPRNLLLVTASADKYTADPENIINQALEAYKEHNADHKLIHKKYDGGHALTQERFDHIIDWLVSTAESLNS